MGIAGAVLALSWIVTSFMANLISVIGFEYIFIIAGGFLLLGGFLHLLLKEKDHYVSFRWS